jgi:hypothetical protein
VEGWRAALTVVLRYGLSIQKQASETDLFTPEGESNKGEEDIMEDDGVKAMVAGVKSRGVSSVFCC